MRETEGDRDKETVLFVHFYSTTNHYKNYKKINSNKQRRSRKKINNKNNKKKQK